MKNFRLSWFIVGSIGLIVIGGLGWDMWRTFYLKKDFEGNAVEAARIAGSHLPFEPAVAVDAGMKYLAEEGIKLDAGGIRVSPDGKSVDVTIYSDVRAYFAWMVGSPTFRFEAKAHADVIMKGGGPPSSMPTGEIAFAIRDAGPPKFGQQLLLWASDPAPPDYAVEVYRVSGPGTLQVGEKIPISRLSDLSEYASNATRRVVILEGLDGEDGTARIKGFAALRTMRLDPERRLLAMFERARVDGTPDRQLEAAHDFGLWQGGEVEVRAGLVK